MWSDYDSDSIWYVLLTIVLVCALCLGLAFVGWLIGWWIGCDILHVLTDKNVYTWWYCVWAVTIVALGRRKSD